MKIPDMIVSPETCGTTLALIFFDGAAAPQHNVKYEDALRWDPQTILAELAELAHQDVPPHNFDKLMAAISICRDRAFFDNLRAFQRLSVALNGHGMPGPDEFDPPSAEEAAWAMNEAVILAPPDDEFADEFNPIIGSYLRVLLDHEGIHHPEGVLQLAGLPAESSAALRHALSHSPDELASIERASRDRSKEIMRSVRHRLDLLAAQLREAPLQTPGASERAWHMAGLISGVKDERKK